MRTTTKIGMLVLTLWGLTGNLIAQDETQPLTIPLRFDHYYTYEQVVEAMKLLHKTYPSLTELNLLGKSEEGREIWELTIHNPAAGDLLDKPGVYVDGNIHGNEIQAGEVCLYLADLLLTHYGKNDRITQLVNRNVFYIVPVVNVDGRYHFFADPNTMHSNRSIRRPKDDDHDGRINEDFPDDLDGDGNICMMRKRDPNGKYRTDPRDPRLMVRVEPGEKGEWTLLGPEGIDNDGDGRINEDAEGYVDPNRNWGYNWAPSYVQNGSGDYPFSGNGMRAIASFMMAHPNIIVVWAFHNYGGMILRGPSTKQEHIPPQDIRVYDYLGKNGEKIIPGYRYLISWKDLYSTYGDFTDFTDNIVGTYSFVGELFRPEQETYRAPGEKEGEKESALFGEKDAERTRERLRFNDYVAMGMLYKPWKPYHHPVYGDIEIGGWVKMSTRLPHPFMLEDLVHRAASAVLFTAGQTPDVKLELLGKKKIGKGLWQVRVRLSNDKAIPSMSTISVQEKLYPKDQVIVEGKDITVVAGGELLDEYTGRTRYKEKKPQIQFVQVPGFGHTDLQFLVKGKGKMTVRYRSRKAGTRELTVEL